MVFVCESCHFLFSRAQQPEQCPDCGKYAIRPADMDEQAEFERYITNKEDIEESKVIETEDDMELLPDLCEIEINEHLSYFTFLLPATALGFRDDMILEISVEYWKSEDETQYHANVWARQKESRAKLFVYPALVPVSETPELSIIESLNTNEVFIDIMHDFIGEIRKQRCV